MGGVIRNRRLVREKPEGGLSTGLLPPRRFPRWGVEDDHFLSWWRERLPNDANVLILSGLCIGPARWALLIIPCTYGQACSANYLASVTPSLSAR